MWLLQLRALKLHLSQACNILPRAEDQRLGHSQQINGIEKTKLLASSMLEGLDGQVDGLFFSFFFFRKKEKKKKKRKKKLQILKYVSLLTSLLIICSPFLVPRVYNTFISGFPFILPPKHICHEYFCLKVCKVNNGWNILQTSEDFRRQSIPASDCESQNGVVKNETRGPFLKSTLIIIFFFSH